MKFPIPNDWDGESWCRWAVCWPDSELWRGFLRGLLTLPQRGRTWDERSGSIFGVQAIGREITEANLPLVGVIMACNDEELATAFQNIAIALGDISVSLTTNARLTASAGCCENQGSAGAGESDPPPMETPGSEGSPAIDPPPDGFSSWEEFFTQKCAIATDIVKQLERDLGSMSIINFGSISLTGLASLITLVIATPIPFDDIIAIAGLLAAVAAEIILTTALDIVNTNETELICELYNGTTSESSRSMFLSKFGDLVNDGVSDPVEAFAIKALMAYMIGASVTNRLYFKDLTRIWEGGDCSSCVPEWWSCVFGDVLEWTDLTVTVQSVAAPDFDALAAIAYANENDIVTLSAEILEGSWSAPSDVPEFASSWSEDAELCGAGAGSPWDDTSAAFEEGPVVGRVLQHRSNDGLTIKYTRGAP